MQSNQEEDSSAGSQYRIIVFDFDGTLIDSMYSFADTAARVIEDFYGMDIRTGRQRYLETSGLPFRLQLEEIFPDDDRNQAAAERFEKTKMFGITIERFYSEVSDVITEIRKHGVLVAISSNNFIFNVNRLLNKAGISVDLVLGYHPGFHKGDPHFSLVKRRLQVDTNEILYVGDSLKDGGWSLEHGVQFIGKTGTVRKIDFLEKYPGITVIDDLQEILPIIFNGPRAGN